MCGELCMTANRVCVRLCVKSSLPYEALASAPLIHISSYLPPFLPSLRLTHHTHISPSLPLSPPSFPRPPHALPPSLDHMTSTALLKVVDADEGAKTNTKIKEVDACAEQNVVAVNVRNNARDMNVVAIRTAITDTNKVFRGATKSNKANTVAVKSELVKPRIEIDDEEKVEAIEGNKMGVVSARLVTVVIIMRS